MSAPKILPSDSELRRMVEAGMSHRQIADKVSEQAGRPIARSSVAAALSRAGLTQQATRYAEEIPWRVASEHLTEYPVRMLRLLGRRRVGGEMTQEEARRLDSWMQQLAEGGAVVAYSPTRGFMYVPAREGIDGQGGIPIRRDVVREEQIA